MKFMHKDTLAWLETIGGQDAISKLDQAIGSLTVKAQTDNVIYKGEDLNMEKNEDVQKEENPVNAEQKDTEEKVEEVTEPVAKSEETAEEEVTEPVAKSEDEEEVVVTLPALAAVTTTAFEEVAQTINAMQQRIDELEATVKATNEALTKMSEDAALNEKAATVPFMSFGSLLSKTQTTKAAKEEPKAELAEELLKSAPDETPNDTEEKRQSVIFELF